MTATAARILTADEIDTACDYLMRSGAEVERDTREVLVYSHMGNSFVVPNNEIVRFVHSRDKSPWLAKG